MKGSNINIINVENKLMKKPNNPTLLLKKARYHQAQGEYLEALMSINKGLIHNPNNHALSKQKDLLISQLKEMNEHVEHESLSELETEAMFREVVCQTAYLEKLQKYVDLLKVVSELSFEQQLKKLIELIKFLIYVFGDINDTSRFIKPSLLEKTDLGKKQKFRLIGNKVLSSLDVENNRVMSISDESAFNTFCWLNLQNAGYDTYFQDSWQLIRIVFEIIYNFPRDKRGAIDQDKKLSLTWYNLDFCGALFTPEAIEGLRTGVSSLPYCFSGSQNKIELFASYQYTLMQNLTIIKAAIPDIIKYDMKNMLSFFTDLYGLVSASEPGLNLVKPMANLPNLYSLVWSCKQSFFTHRILSFLPAVPGNSARYKNEFTAAAKKYKLNMTSIANQAIDFRALVRQRLKSAGHSPFMNGIFLACADELQNNENVKAGYFEDRFTESDITYGIDANEEKRSPLVDFFRGSSDQQLFTSERLLSGATSNFSVKTLKGRLHLVRILQIIGEIFTLRNWGSQQLKRVDYVNYNALLMIRNGLVHIEEYGYNNVILCLENNVALLCKVFRELQALKEAIYEDTVKRQSAFDNLPSNFGEVTSSGYLAWSPFAIKFWRSIQKYYSSSEKMDNNFSNYFPKTSLLSASEDLNHLASLFSAELKQQMFKFLSGESAYPQKFNNNKNPFANKGWLNASPSASPTNQEKKLVKNAVKAYFKKKKAVQSKAEDEAREAKKARNKKIESIMKTAYPSLRDLSSRFHSAESEPHPDVKKLITLVQNRLEHLKRLIKDEDIDCQDKESFQRIMMNVFRSKMQLLFSFNYLLCQIISLFNKLASLGISNNCFKEMRASMSDYIALRNHLEHIDPIIESRRVAHFHMEGMQAEFQAVLLGEIIFDHAKNITILSSESVQIDSACPRIKQDYPLNFERFKLKHNPSPLPQPSIKDIPIACENPLDALAPNASPQRAIVALNNLRDLIVTSIKGLTASLSMKMELKAQLLIKFKENEMPEKVFILLLKQFYLIFSKLSSDKSLSPSQEQLLQAIQIYQENLSINSARPNQLANILNDIFSNDWTNLAPEQAQLRKQSVTSIASSVGLFSKPSTTDAVASTSTFVAKPGSD